MNRKKLLRAVESTAATAAEKGHAAIDEAVQRLTPLIEQAEDVVGPLAQEARRKGVEFAVDTYDRVQPHLESARKRGADLASETYERLQPTIEDARKRGVEFASEAYEKVHPHLHEAKKRGARFAAETLDRVHPALDEALDRVTPAVDSAVRRAQPVVDEALHRIAPTVDVARDKLQHDLLPRLSDALHRVGELVSEIELVTEPAPVAKRFGVLKTIGLVALAGAVLGGVVLALKKLLAGDEAGWETHEPSRPYVADPVADVVDEPTAEEPPVADETTDEEATPEAEAVAAEELASEEAVEEAAAAEASSEDEGKGDAAPLAVSPYGEGSYVGAEPPEGYDIKGNERSMKYHLQGSGGYERTITDVWFSSAEAAEQAGFVRAQR